MAGRQHGRSTSRRNRLPPNPNPARGIADEAARACVYLPHAPAQRILYLLRGVGDNEYSWEIQGHVSALAEHLAQSDGMPLSLIVMPFGFMTQENKLQRRFPDRAEFDDYMLPLVGRLERLYESKGKLTAGSATAPSPALDG